MNVEKKAGDSTSSNLAARIRSIRREIYGDGEFGQELLATQLDVPIQTWANYESGVAMPGSLMLHFLDRTGVRPGWLLTGRGERFLDD